MFICRRISVISDETADCDDGPPQVVCMSLRARVLGRAAAKGSAAVCRGADARTHGLQNRNVCGVRRAPKGPTAAFSLACTSLHLAGSEPYVCCCLAAYRWV